MKSKLKYIVLIVCTISMAAISYYLGYKVRVKEQLEIVTSLREISAIVFGVMGAWIAILYPKSLKDIYRLDVDSNQILGEAKRIFLPIRWATFIVTISLGYTLLYPALIEAGIPSIFHPAIRGVSFFLIGLLVIAQVYSLILSLIPMDKSEKDLSIIHQARESHESRMSQVQRIKPPQ
jgi:hypothetical protein